MNPIDDFRDGRGARKIRHGPINRNLQASIDASAQRGAVVLHDYRLRSNFLVAKAAPGSSDGWRARPK